MKIKSVEISDRDMGNSKFYEFASKSISDVRNVFVELTLSDGTSGFGAANPSLHVVGETFGQCRTALEEADFEFLIGREITELNQLIYEVQTRFVKTPGARAALDISLFDAFTRHIEMPLVSFLGQKIKSLPTSITVGIKGIEETIKEIEDFKKQGFFVFKIKLGKKLEEDIERLTLLREHLGKSSILRVDANEGYNFQEAVRFFEATRNLDLELIEQPLPSNCTKELYELPEEMRKITAVDESLTSPKDALRLSSPVVATQIFNIKLMKCGGISEALKIAEIAHLSGIDLFWGCNDESVVSIAAALHTALSCPNTKYLDLDGSLDLALDPFKGGFTINDGVIIPSMEPGLGITRLN